MQKIIEEDMRVTYYIIYTILLYIHNYQGGLTRVFQ